MKVYKSSMGTKLIGWGLIGLVGSGLGLMGKMIYNSFSPDSPINAIYSAEQKYYNFDIDGKKINVEATQGEDFNYKFGNTTVYVDDSELFSTYSEDIFVDGRGIYDPEVKREISKLTKEVARRIMEIDKERNEKKYNQALNLVRQDLKK